MAGRTVSIGAQDFAELRENDYFLVDKSAFVNDWWQAGDKVTLVCRPRRFGKTLTLDMVRCFLSCEYAGRGEELFGGMDVWAGPAMRALQGTVPVVSVTFADCKGGTFGELSRQMRGQVALSWMAHPELLEDAGLTVDERGMIEGGTVRVAEEDAAGSLRRLCALLERHYGCKPVVLLDEYDTPMQEAWLAGCWDQMSRLVRGLFNSTFKTNRYLGRALITGIMRVASESIFSDMNNPTVATVTTNQYTTAFGFTESEVFDAMAEMGLNDREGVKFWYDGFTFGKTTGIYNPWSITNYLVYGELLPYWTNTSSNDLVSTLVRSGGGQIQHDFEALLTGGSVEKTIGERVNFRALEGDEGAVWSLLLAAGYVRADSALPNEDGRLDCELHLVNNESRACFAGMVQEWFSRATTAYNGFTRTLLAGNLEEAEDYLSDVLEACASSFDGGAAASDKAQPERFYHGLVLGMLVDLRGRYRVTSNGESGRGRYDVVLQPLQAGDPALVIEFKVFDPRHEKTLDDTVERAKTQIRERAYATQLTEAGIEPSRIHEIGFGFSGKDVRIG